MQEHCQPWGNNYSTDHFRFAEDTLINDTLYKRVFTADDEFYEEWFFYGAFIREENKKVFYREMFGSEGLIYDFNLEIGDSCIINNPRSVSEIKLTLTAIDSVETSDGYRKRWRLDNDFYPNPEYWYEGIGSDAGVINSSTGIFGGLCGSYTMLCEKENDVVIYQNPFYETCYYLLLDSEEQQAAAEHDFQLIYNSQTQSVTLGFDHATQKQVFISDMSGRMLHHSASNQQLLDISLSGNISGLYVVRVIVEGKASSKKFMVF